MPQAAPLVHGGRKGDFPGAGPCTLIERRLSAGARAGRWGPERHPSVPLQPGGARRLRAGGGGSTQSGASVGSGPCDRPPTANSVGTQPSCSVSSHFPLKSQ